MSEDEKKIKPTPHRIVLTGESVVADGVTRGEQAQLLAKQRIVAYSQVFASTPASQLVLKDLERFCRAKQSTFDRDPRRHALLEGRREVILRIYDFINLTVDEILSKYEGAR